VRVRFLDLEDLLALAADLGVREVRDLGLLAAAAQRPTTTLYGHDAYPTLAAKAAVLLESVVRNHALVDGNKRLGWLCMVVFLGLNGVELDVDDDEAYDRVVEVAAGRAEWQQIASWLNANGVP